MKEAVNTYDKQMKSLSKAILAKSAMVHLQKAHVKNLEILRGLLDEETVKKTAAEAALKEAQEAVEEHIDASQLRVVA